MKSELRSFLLLVHYWFPIALGWSVALVIQRATGSPFSLAGIGLYLLCICAAYSLDRLLDNAGKRHPAWLTGALWSGLAVSIAAGAFLALRLSIQSLSALAVFCAITLLYRKAKKFPLLKTALVAVVWIWAAVALTLSNPGWFAWRFWTLQASVPLVMLVGAGCILCDFKDWQLDDQGGVGTLPVLFGLHKTILITSGIVLVAGLVSFGEGRMGLVASSALLILLAQFPGLLSLEAIGPLLVDLALTVPGLLISLRLV